MTNQARAAEIMVRWKAGQRFYSPGFPPMFEPQPYTARAEMTDAQRDNMRRGKDAANERVRAHKQLSKGGLAHATGTPFNPQDDFGSARSRFKR